MEKKKKRSLEEIFADLKEAEKEFDEKLLKYGMKEIKPKKDETQGESPNDIEGESNSQSEPSNDSETENKDA